MRFILIIFISLMAVISYAQKTGPIQTDRPDQTECPFIVLKKHFQIETGFSYEKISKESGSILIPAVLIKYGISESTELRLITEIEQVKYQSKKHTGLNPVTIGFKTKLAKEKGLIPEISFIGHLTLPHVASSKNKTTYYAPAFRFALQHTLSEKISLGYNLGAEWDGETAEATFIYTITSGISLAQRTGCYIELYGFLPQQSKPDHRLDGGFTFLINNNILFDIEAGLGISDSSPPYFIGTGLSCRF